MSTDDELRERMHRLAAAHDVAELSADDVVAEHASKARHHRLFAVAAVLLLVIGLAGVIRLVDDDEGADADVASGADSDEPDAVDDAAEENAPDDAGADAPAAEPTDMAAGGDAASSYYGGGTEWVVPWGDGFLASGQVLEPSDATMTDLVPDIADRLPPEVVEALGDVTDVAEATALLSEAGLLDEATEAVMNDPELFDAYNQITAGGTYRYETSISPDGETWTVLDDFGPPGGLENVNQARSDGEHLVLVEQRWNEGDTTGSLTIHLTNDLVEWTSLDVPTEPSNAPEFVYEDRYVNGLSVGPDGWYLSVATNAWIDVWSLLPADVKTEFDGGYGWSADAEGVRVSTGMVEYTTDGDVGSTDVAVEGSDDGAGSTVTTTVGVRGEPGESRLVPWSEIGITYADYERYALGETASVSAFSGTWDGTIAPAGTPDVESCCTVVGTDAGFLAHSWGWWDEVTGEVPAALFFSSDGGSWSSIQGPGGSSSISSLAAVERGVLATDGSGGIWRAAADGTGWTPIEIQGLPSTVNLWFDQQQHRGVVSLIDTAVYEDEVDQVPYTVEFELDGFGIRSDNGPDGATDVQVTDLATGEVVLDRSFNQYTSVEPEFVRLESESGNISLLDDDGDVIVSVPMDLYSEKMSEALEAAHIESGWAPSDDEYAPDFWLVATNDGIDWYVEDLADDGGFGFGQVAINGNTVIARDWEGGWELFTIG